MEPRIWFTMKPLKMVVGIRAGFFLKNSSSSVTIVDGQVTVTVMLVTFLDVDDRIIMLTTLFVMSVIFSMY